MLSEHYNELVVLVGVSLLGLTAGVVGCFAVLRRRALLGDALAHATLPGVCLGFVLAGNRSMPLLLAGSLATGLLSVLAFVAIQRFARIREDVAIGIVLSGFYAAGVVWLRALPSSSQAGLESFLFGKTAGMLFQDVVWIGGLAAASLIVTAILFKELRLIAFDAEYARALGWPTGAIDVLLLVLIALAVVVGLPAVGALLVAALLVIPAAAARFWTDRLAPMLAIAGFVGMASGLIGAAVSIPLSRIPTGPAIILAALAFFALSLAANAFRRNDGGRMSKE